MTALRNQQRTSRIRIMGAMAGALVLIALASELLGGAATPRSDLQGEPVLPGFAETRAEASQIRITLADATYTLLLRPGAGGWKAAMAIPSAPTG